MVTALRRILHLLCLAGLATGASALAANAPAQPAQQKQKAPAAQPAQPPQATPQQQADLDALRQRIQALDASINEINQSYTAAEKERRASERAVSSARRKLRNIEREQAQISERLAAQEKELDSVTARIEARRTELADLLAHRYRHGANSVAPFLAARDPNQIARDLHYLEYIGKAQLEIINTLRADLQAHETLNRSIVERRAELTRLASAQEAEKRSLEARLKERSRAVERLNAELSGKKEEVASLRRNEKDLSRIIHGLDAKHSEEDRQAQAAAAPAASSSRIRQEPFTGTIKKPPQQDPAPAAPVARSSNVASGTINRPPIKLAPPSGKGFAALRGKLVSPVAGGRILARFDQPRSGGGTRWHGLLIKAANGAPVRAAASGRVVYADWLRGYGNLVILDHGGGYLTVYGHNDTLQVTVGERVESGQTIAQAGNSGSVSDSGVYFEIRKAGQALDPKPWLRD